MSVRLALVLAPFLIWAGHLAAAPGDFDSYPSFVNSFPGTDFGGEDVPRALVLQPDGKIVGGGETCTDECGEFCFSSCDFALARYNPDGTLDTGFGAGGKVTTDFGSGRDRGMALVLQPDGKLIMSGDPWAIARYMTDGSLDPTFGNGGKVLTDLGGTVQLASTIVLQPDGRFVVMGLAGQNQLALARYNPDGSLDQSFGTGGSVVTGFRASSFDGNGGFKTNPAVQQADGKVIAGATTDDGRGELVRFNVDGSVDSTFGIGGEVTLGVEGDMNAQGHINALLFQADGKLLVGFWGHISAPAIR